MTIKIYTGKHCQPCHPIEEMVRQGKISEDVELIDIESDEGFKKFKREVMDPSDVETALFVPSAYKDGKLCKIGYDETGNLLVFECPTTDDHPSSDEE